MTLNGIVNFHIHMKTSHLRWCVGGSRQRSKREKCAFNREAFFKKASADKSPRVVPSLLSIERNRLKVLLISCQLQPPSGVVSSVNFIEHCNQCNILIKLSITVEHITNKHFTRSAFLALQS